jgi:hypothetical protein
MFAAVRGRALAAAGATAGNDGGLGGLGGAGQGGGLYLAGGVVTLTDSTIAANSAQGGQGGDGGDPGTPDAIGGNGGDGGLSQGGGIFNAGPLNLTNSTIADNLALDSLGGLPGAAGSGAPSDGADQTGQGGGVFNIAAVDVANTLIAANTASSAPDFSGDFASARFNLLGIGDGSNLAPAQPDANGNQVGSAASPINPQLGPLADNGGPTETLALQAGSPAIDAGSNGLAVDANGQPLLYDQRDAGFSRIRNSLVDIGAYEFPSAGPNFTDNFNRPNATTLGPDWQFSGSFVPAALRAHYRWRLPLPYFQVQNGVAISVVPNASTKIAAAQVTGQSLQDPTVRAYVDASAPQSVAVGVFARAQSDSDAYVAALTHGGTAEILLFHPATNTCSVLASASAGTNAATLTFTVTGTGPSTTLALFLDKSSTPLVSASGSTQTILDSAGGVGLFAWGADGLIDNFLVSGS